MCPALFSVYSLKIPNVKPDNVCKILDHLKTGNEELFDENENLLEFYQIIEFLKCDDKKSRIKLQFDKLVLFEKETKKRNKCLFSQLSSVKETLELERARFAMRERSFEKALGDERQKVLKAQADARLWKSMYERFETPDTSVFDFEDQMDTLCQNTITGQTNYLEIEFKTETTVPKSSKN